MNKAQLLEQLEKLGMRPGRGLGQNFLLDGNLLDSIVRDAAPQPGELILEVGPGFGALTRKLLAAGCEVVAVEFDHRLAEYLRGSIQSDRFTLVEDDACRVDFGKILPPGRPFRAIANLPYSISSIFVARMLELPSPPLGMSFMLQKEMAERLSSPPGNKSYGALSVRAQAVYDVSIRRLVPPEVFFPPPEVDSAICLFRLKPEIPSAEQRKKLSGVVKTAFAQRRKQMGKVLSANYSKEQVRSAFDAMGMSLEIRPDKVTVEEFEKLAGLMFP